MVLGLANQIGVVVAGLGWAAGQHFPITNGSILHESLRIELSLYIVKSSGLLLGGSWRRYCCRYMMHGARRTGLKLLGS